MKEKNSQDGYHGASLTSRLFRRDDGTPNWLAKGIIGAGIAVGAVACSGGAPKTGNESIDFYLNVLTPTNAEYERMPPTDTTIYVDHPSVIIEFSPHSIQRYTQIGWATGRDPLVLTGNFEDVFDHVADLHRRAKPYEAASEERNDL